jgi:Uma2 family endonuclease
MASPTTPTTDQELFPFSRNLDTIPVLYEDEDEGDMGESNPHVVSDKILHVCVEAHLAGRPEFRVFSNMNLYYRDGPRHPRTGSLPYVSPDVMIVVPFRPLGDNVTSYTIGADGPAPLSVSEILSERSAQQRDLKEKVTLYAELGVGEYILIDPTGEFLPARLLLKRLQPDGTYKDEKDQDGGITSCLGFRLIFDKDGLLRVLDAATGKPYIRPAEAQQKLRHLEAEIERLKGLLKKQDKPTKKKKEK